MNRYEKIIQKKSLEEVIAEKKSLIKKEKQQLSALEKQYKAIDKSELPILMFTIDYTMPMPNHKNDYEYEMIYYYPDLNEVKCISRHHLDLLPNTIDFRTFFTPLSVPTKMWPGKVWDNNAEKIEYATSILQNIIEDSFSSNQINDWPTLGELLSIIANKHSITDYTLIENNPNKVLKR